MSQYLEFLRYYIESESAVFVLVCTCMFIAVKGHYFKAIMAQNRYGVEMPRSLFQV